MRPHHQFIYRDLMMLSDTHRVVMRVKQRGEHSCFGGKQGQVRSRPHARSGAGQRAFFPTWKGPGPSAPFLNPEAKNSQPTCWVLSPRNFSETLGKKLILFDINKEFWDGGHYKKTLHTKTRKQKLRGGGCIQNKESKGIT